MSNCQALKEPFFFKPCVYLLFTNPDQTHYRLYVSVTLPPLTTLLKETEELDGADGQVVYSIQEDPDGCQEPWVFQEIIPATIDSDIPIIERRVSVEVNDREAKKGKMIVHHADADEPDKTSPAAT